jgi:hypothetical protein
VSEEMAEGGAAAAAASVDDYLDDDEEPYQRNIEMWLCDVLRSTQEGSLILH